MKAKSQDNRATVPLGKVCWKGRNKHHTRARWPALTSAAIAGFVLLGWTFDVEFLKRIVPGLAAMNPMTAIAFALAALSLSLFDKRKPLSGTRWWSSIGKGCGMLVALVGALRLLALVSPLDAGVDRWLFPAKLAANSALPSSMAPNAAFDFLLVGSALLLLYARSLKISAWASVFALISGFEALLALLGYLYGISSLYGVGTFTPMALHTAICFVATSFGIMAAQSDRGFLAIIMGKSAGGTMARTLLPVAIFVPALLGWLRLEGQRLGLYDSDFGEALFTVTNMLVFASIIACNALSVFRADMKRTKAELRVQRAHVGLERGVAERTEQLAQANAGLQKAAEELEERVRERTASLAETEARLHAIVDNAHSSVHVKDLEGKFVLVNQGFAAFLGTTKEALIGRTDRDFYSPELAERLAAEDGRVLAGAGAPETEETLPGAHGLRTFMSNKFPLRDASGNPNGICGVSRDVTDRKRVAVALQSAKEEADRANRAKSEFLSRMSHELRTPMNAILGFAQLLEFDELNDSQRDGVDHILRGGRHLLELINEVLDISRIEAGHVSLSCEPVEVTEALQETLDLVQPLAAERSVRLISMPCASCYVLADQQRVKQVLINLISNAIKYNRLAGSVTIACQTSAGRARILITDTGVGIPSERIGQLFTPFERLGAEQTAIEGTGLGLSVAKRLVEAMDGTIGVESLPGQGTTFWVEFPVAEPPLETAALPQEFTQPTLLASEGTQKVLYIEDNLSNLRLIERLIERRPSLQLIAAHEGIAGLKLAQQSRPDLILLDVNLPDIDGHEVLLRLRADPGSASIPVVAISADATRGQKERIMKAGASGYLTKPLNVSRFLEVLDSTLIAGRGPS